MNTKPTYKELENKIKLLENKIVELEGRKRAIQRNEARLKEAERIAKIGHWELDLVSNTLYWSDEILIQILKNLGQLMKPFLIPCILKTGELWTTRLKIQ